MKRRAGTALKGDVHGSQLGRRNRTFVHTADYGASWAERGQSASGSTRWRSVMSRMGKAFASSPIHRRCGWQAQVLDLRMIGMLHERYYGRKVKVDLCL